MSAFVQSFSCCILPVLPNFCLPRKHFPFGPGKLPERIGKGILWLPTKFDFLLFNFARFFFRIPRFLYEDLSDIPFPKSIRARLVALSFMMPPNEIKGIHAETRSGFLWQLVDQYRLSELFTTTIW